MPQVDQIIKSLMEAVSGTTALATSIPGGLRHGNRVPGDTVKPFATLLVEEASRQGHSSRVWIVDYVVNLKVYTAERVDQAGQILRTFHKYFDRLSGLDSLDLTEARFLLIAPDSKQTVEEDKSEEFGKDIIVGTTRWLLRIEEFQTAITV